MKSVSLTWREREDRIGSYLKIMKKIGDIFLIISKFECLRIALRYIFFRADLLIPSWILLD